ncbi:unnamed protein product [Nezara viridula]|uniref:Uncharacterized protein n=1 Tax=Nezara viridula TaxID=85310 RepID=A0A9P0H979_NEZVI|nr:unnamed protein product [Nezara viridula]
MKEKKYDDSMILFSEYLVGNMDPTMPTVTEDTAELLEDPEAFMPTEETPVVIYQKSKVIFFAYFIPIIFLVLGIIIFMGAVIQKFKKHNQNQNI